MTVSNKIKVFINIFVYYPEVYNSTVINTRLSKYVNEYFIINNPQNSIFDSTNVMIKCAPHNENQMMIIDVNFSNGIDESIKKEKLIKDWKEYFYIYFDKQIKEIIIKFC